ncbi:hypothetical protein CLV59_10533 [Chitinophaga dinghuensis]|uniref:WGR domain-containing protein n=1 Tax=Chitinophaga dinghuensis TaxID=1539050 RepID=A0A327W4N6_9BACT|nr:hypothetical protein [Chitinophaga dinghuensis]RAJ79928.1 hypothetical protein CLV59_10533 [Chitinophaga dinghuensis]
MKFVRNVKLFFREGNSDKTYEIDLCEVGPDQYLVNFRYGKRGANLKEGTKTASPVPLASATTIFDALEKEKRSKGYIGEQESAAQVQMESVSDDTMAEVLNPRHKAILKRLQGKPGGKNAWKTSRVIWRAGQLKIREAAPYIIRQGDRKDAIQRYAAIWAMSRAGDPTAIPALKAYAENSAYPLNIRMLAANGISMLLPEEELGAFLQPYYNGLPDVIRFSVDRQVPRDLHSIMVNHIMQQVLPQYTVLEDLYLLSGAYPVIRQALLPLLAQLPLRPSWFQHIRHIYKQAEMKDDHIVVALLAKRMFLSKPMFSMPPKPEEGWQPEIYIPELQDFVKAHSEIKKPGSRIAFSHKTRRYFTRRVLRRLKQLGQDGDDHYVRFSTALLLQHAQEVDASNAYQERVYQYVNNRYTTVDKQYPENSKAVFLNYIIRGNAPDLQYINGREEWMFKPKETTDTNTRRAQPNPDLEKKASGNLMKKLFSWLNTDKHLTPQPGEYQPDSQPEVQSDVPYLHLWKQLPEAFIQLLIGGQMEQVHAFALEQLKAHERFEEIKAKIDEDIIIAFLFNRLTIPPLFGLELAREKYNPAAPSHKLLKAMSLCPQQQVREQALQWIKEGKNQLLTDAGFLLDLIFSPYDEVRKFLTEVYPPEEMTFAQSQVLAGKATSWLMVVEAPNDAANHVITEACRMIELYCTATLKEMDMQVINDLMSRDIVAVQAFAVRLLLLKTDTFNFDVLSGEMLEKLLESEYGPLRDAGFALIRRMTDEELLRRPAFILFCCSASFKGVRRQSAQLVKRLIPLDERLAIWLVNELVPMLMRTEKSEGMHEDIANLLSTELVGYLHDVDTATALRLLYANYRPAQEFGLVVLEKYIPADTLTIKQIIATGAHELLQAREWCWRYYRENESRIRAEKDGAVALLDSKWDDTRQFAIQYFGSVFQEADWSPESLIALADSVRPDIQRFGRELLMRFFKSEDGPQYLLKLSQHPSTAMQTFATGYLTNYASGNLEYIQSMEHYFRSVLTRVNKARVAKERIFTFLETEALKSKEAATFIGTIIADISATVAIGDKARCISMMRSISQQYEVALPIQFVEPAVRLQ